ncbi:hypothetical protein KGF54_000189 [Candida jiufengensis]|uniref:uncharacterized protein n=1 Tax=Candida jiufengensis TaxID=497108 RepID=UPI0022250665|nr:uncharacterized protein KGF54_000189 [Candida jiufengensis]KAI5957261.1 hypothetical protein KGF54_000189 [Candida jiufengensis]
MTFSIFLIETPEYFQIFAVLDEAAYFILPALKDKAAYPPRVRHYLHKLPQPAFNVVLSPKGYNNQFVAAISPLESKPSYFVPVKLNRIWEFRYHGSHHCN